MELIIFWELFFGSQPKGEGKASKSAS
jgi:hypothetical protein